MLCPCCGKNISLGVRECGCGARFVGPPLNDTPIKIQRFGPAMSAVALLVVVASAALIFTKWLAVAAVAVVWAARRAMKLARREPEWYGGYRVATATLLVTIVAGAVASGYAISHVPRFLENRKARQIAATQAAMYQEAGMLEDYKRAFGSYPPSTQEIRKIITDQLPTDYWDKTISYQGYTAGIADSAGRIRIPTNNFELRSAGPDGEMGTDDDIIMRDGIFYTSDEVKKLPSLQETAGRQEVKKGKGR